LDLPSVVCTDPFSTDCPRRRKVVLFSAVEFFRAPPSLCPHVSDCLPIYNLSSVPVFFSDSWKCWTQSGGVPLPPPPFYMCAHVEDRVLRSLLCQVIYLSSLSGFPCETLARIFLPLIFPRPSQTVQRLVAPRPPVSLFLLFLLSLIETFEALLLKEPYALNANVRGCSF